MRVKVKNTGAVAGKEVVELYMHDCQTDIVRPYKELKGFQKLSLEPGEEKEAVFELDKRSFAYYDVEAKVSWFRADALRSWWELPARISA